MLLISVQQGGLDDVDGVILGLQSELGRGLLEIGVGLPLLFVVVVWFIPVHSAAESVVVHVDIFLKVTQVV